jgi:hypothetical protein
MLYNNDQCLWDNQHSYCKSLPNGGPIHTVHDGHVGNGREVLARFKSDAQAIATLLLAGFHEVKTSQPNSARQFKA